MPGDKAGRRSMKTSESDPIRVDFLIPGMLGLSGRIGMTISPGKKHLGMTGHWDRHLDTDLLRLRDHYRVNLLISLLEQHEYERLGIGDLIARANALGMATVWFPIADGSVPTSMEAFIQLIERIITSTREGQTVVIHCRGGLGRTGLVAASCLVASGHAPGKALELVRQVRPGSIENLAQEHYLRSFKEAWAARPNTPDTGHL